MDAVTQQAPRRSRGPAKWTFITNHAAALMVIAELPRVRLTDLADRLGVTERAAQRIVRDLDDEGYITITRAGRRNTYRVVEDRMMRHPLVRAVPVSGLLQLLEPPQ